jgi:hypothetical protein
VFFRSSIEHQASSILPPVVCRRSSVVGRPSSVVCRRSSVFCRLSSVFRRRSSAICPQSSVFRRLSSVVCHLSSVFCLPLRFTKYYSLNTIHFPSHIFQIFSIVSHHFSNIFKRFAPLFKRFQTFSIVFERFYFAWLAQTLYLNPQSLFLTQKPALPPKNHPQNHPFF